MTKDVTALLNQGLIKLQAGEWAEALNVLDNVLAAEPSHPDALWWKGVTCLQLGDPEQAVDFIEQAYSARPNDAEICNDLGMALESVHEQERARAFYDKAMGLDPKLVSAYVNSARLTLASGDAEAALDAANTAISIDSNVAGAHNVKGTALRHLGQLEDALKPSRNLGE